MGKILTQDEFISRCISRHGNRYDYSKVKYTSSRNNITIICNIHGEFDQEAHGHVRGKNCPKCGKENCRIAQVFDKSIFSDKANIVHSNFYGYDNVVYYNNLSKVVITCPIHGNFIQGAREHLRGNGCPMCGRMINNGYTKDKWINYCIRRGKELASVYIVKLYDDYESFIKIGLTAKNVPERFAKSQSIPYKWELIKEIKCAAGDAFDLENSLQLAYKDFRYKPNKKFAGCAECFNISILNKVK